MKNWMILIASCLIAVVGDNLIAWYAKRPAHSLILLTLGLVCSVAGMLVWAFAMKVGIESSKAITVYAVLTTLSVTALGVFAFGEQLNIRGYTGVVAGIISLLLLGW